MRSPEERLISEIQISRFLSPSVMHLPWALVLLALSVLALPNRPTPWRPSPRTGQKDPQVDMDLSKYENHFDLCDAAINCEIASDENGVRHIRFVSGMEPGTKIYDLTSLMAGAPEHTSFWNENLHDS